MLDLAPKPLRDSIAQRNLVRGAKVSFTRLWMTDKIHPNPRQHLELLQQQRTKLSHLIQTLSSTPLTRPADLVDSEGFPLPSADLELLRESRQRQRQRNEAQTDYKRIMREIEELLPLAFERNDNDRVEEEEEGQGIHQPFALVTSVGKDTLAHQAGIRAGDKIYRFGKLFKVSFASDTELIAAIKEQQVVSRRVLLSVIRGGDDMAFSTSLECSSGAPLGMHLKAILTTTTVIQ